MMIIELFIQGCIMKNLKSLFALFISCSLLATATSCSFLKPKHTHEWSNFLVIAPTCTQKGLLEKLCEDCGEKVYEDITPSGHNYLNGACTVCGSAGYTESQVEPIPMPSNANNTAAFSLQKIYEVKQSILYEDNFSFNDFINSLSNGSLSNIYVDDLGLFHVTSTFTNPDQTGLELPIVWSVGRVSPTNPKASKFGNISIVKMTNNHLTIIYSDGAQSILGQLTGNGVTITHFGLNPDNELVVYYSDNTIAFAGKVPTGQASTTQANFVYCKVANGYEITSTLNYNNTKVFKIPVSHQGKPIVSIANNAFREVSGIATAIVIPSSVTNISIRAFSDLTTSTVLYFEGERPISCNLAGLTAYYVGEWSYVNGIPTPNN